MAAEVIDDKIVCNQKGDLIWIGDCIDLGLSFRNEKEPYPPYIMPLDYNQGGNEYFSDRDYVFGFSPTGPDGTPEYNVYRNPSAQNKKDDTGIKLAAKITPRGYNLEVFISKKYLNCSQKLKPGQEIKFNCGIYDLDQNAIAQDFSMSEWPGTAGDPWSPDTFGRLLIK